MSEFDVILIDMGSVFAAAWHSSVNEAVSYARQRAVAQIRRLAEGHQRVAVCCDSRRNWRKELAPSYKEQREPKPEAYFEEMRRTEETVERDGILVWRCDGFEADDVIATATREACEQGMRVLIHSADKDLTQLVVDSRNDPEVITPEVVVCSPRDGRYYRERDVLDKFGVKPKQMRDWLALVGDSSDNVKGIPGVGPKKASDILRAFGTVEEAIANLTTVRAKEIGGNAVQKALAENLESLALAQKLVTLRTDAPIEFGELFATRVKKPLIDAEYSEVDEDEQESEELMSEGELDTMFSNAPTSNEAPKPPSSPPPPFIPQTPAQVPAQVPAQQPEQRALALASQPFEMQLEPASIGGAYKLAQGLFNARLFARFGNPEAIWAVIIRGREMGLGALTALDCFHVVEGKLALHAHLIAARAKALPECEYFQFLDGDSSFAEYETKHRKDRKPTRLRYTYEQAELAGITRSQKGRTNWEKRPAEMLRKTCAVQLVRMVYPEAALGLYSVEELEAE